MKLKNRDVQPSITGLPGSFREWWDIGNGYEVYIDFGNSRCLLTIDSPGSKDITLEVAKYLGIDSTHNGIKFGSNNCDQEMYLSAGIDCILLNYTKPANYIELLKKIEVIINEHFKDK